MHNSRGDDGQAKTDVLQSYHEGVRIEKVGHGEYGGVVVGAEDKMAR